MSVQAESSSATVLKSEVAQQWKAHPSTVRILTDLINLSMQGLLSLSCNSFRGCTPNLNSWLPVWKSHKLPPNSYRPGEFQIFSAVSFLWLGLEVWTAQWDLWMSLLELRLDCGFPIGKKYFSCQMSKLESVFHRNKCSVFSWLLREQRTQTTASKNLLFLSD